jgi:hypothetical protein
VMRKIRDSLDPAQFQEFTDMVNFFTKPQYELTIKIEGRRADRCREGAHIEGSPVDVIAGVYIKDLMLAEPRSDMAAPEAERMTRLTDKFMENLASATAASTPVVVFFDEVEKGRAKELRTGSEVNCCPQCAGSSWGISVRAVRTGRLTGRSRPGYAVTG